MHVNSMYVNTVYQILSQRSAQSDRLWKTAPTYIYASLHLGNLDNYACCESYDCDASSDFKNISCPLQTTSWPQDWNYATRRNVEALLICTRKPSWTSQGSHDCRRVTAHDLSLSTTSCTTVIFCPTLAAQETRAGLLPSPRPCCRFFHWHHTVAEKEDVMLSAKLMGKHLTRSGRE